MSNDAYILIDRPSPFAPIEDWQDHLAELVEMNAETPNKQLADAIADAEAHIASLR